MTDRVLQLETVQTEAKELFKKKNSDYGDAFATYGAIGVLVRLGDKIHRLQSINTKGINLVDDEKIRDTLIDLHNYAAMAIMLLDENKDLSDNLMVDVSEPARDFNKKTWEIEGETNNYTRETITDLQTRKVTHSCSCPSFKYCRKEVKTCKHIEENY